MARRLQHQLLAEADDEQALAGMARRRRRPRAAALAPVRRSARCGPEGAGVKPGARLIWLPTGALGILPLGLAQDPVSKRRFADDYEIVYAPSLEALATAQSHIAKTSSLRSPPSSTRPATCRHREGRRLVASHFAGNARTVLERTAATPEAVLAALKGKTHWHFASHGTFSWDDARQIRAGHARRGAPHRRPAAGDRRARPAAPCRALGLRDGLYDIDSNPDEFIGLPGTFTALGAAGVLGTLWPVSDAATALLIAKFYELHMGQRLTPPTAFSRAQTWLRQATNADLPVYARLAAKQGRLEARHVAEIEQGAERRWARAVSQQRRSSMGDA